MPIDVSSWWLVGLGAAVLVASYLWRRTVLHNRLATLVADLQLSDADGRIQAGERLVQIGLAPASRAILPQMPHEHDQRVRTGIALAVARRQWEPGGSTAVAALRTWASDELLAQGYPVMEFGPAFARASDMGGPTRDRPPGSPGGPPAAVEPSPLDTTGLGS